MKPNYQDLLDLTVSKPKWFDEHGVPRFCDFEPNLTSNIYADQVALVEIRCQLCRTPFLVALSSRGHDDHSIAANIHTRGLCYGDPPNMGCCDAGPSMTSETVRVVEFWIRFENQYADKKSPDFSPVSYIEWKRRPDLEVSFERTKLKKNRK